jgi:hypothetical protein
VPETGDLKETILREAHNSAYSIHPGSTKMYQDLKQRYWWYGMKRDVAAHVALSILAIGLRLNIRDPLVCFNR